MITKLFSKQSLEWGVLDLNNSKYLDFLIPRKPVRSKMNCTSKKGAKKAWNRFKQKVKKRGLTTAKELNVKPLAGFSDSILFEIFTGKDFFTAYEKLTQRERNKIKNQLCYIDRNDFEKTSSYLELKKDYQYSNNLLLTVRHKKGKNKILWVKGFCSNNGAMTNYSTYSFEGYIGNKKGFSILYRRSDKAGAHAGLFDYDVIAFTEVLSIPPLN